jgi:2-polyprenyl-3-methyl-5-hydroxy-6-metoxy-1,4-benzoquinol methylase
LDDVVTESSAVHYHSQIAIDFHTSYKYQANRHERLTIWRRYLDRYLDGATLVYDMGCGSGILAADIAARGIHTIAIDGSARMLELARRTARERGCTNIEFRQHELPIRATAGFERADAIISSSVVEYLESVGDTLVAFRALLRPRGIVVFSMPNHDSFKRKMVRLVHRLSGRPRYMDLIKHFATVDSLKRDLAAAKLTYLDHMYLEGSGPLDRAIRRITSKRRSNNMIIIAARRD